MRSILATFILTMGLAASGGVSAQTAVNCATAAEVAGRYGGAILALRATFTETAAVGRIVRSLFAVTPLGNARAVADTVQVFHMSPDRYLVVASVQGCHIAHVLANAALVEDLRRV